VRLRRIINYSVIYNHFLWFACDLWLCLQNAEFGPRNCRYPFTRILCNKQLSSYLWNQQESPEVSEPCKRFGIFRRNATVHHWQQTFFDDAAIESRVMGPNQQHWLQDCLAYINLFWFMDWMINEDSAVSIHLILLALCNKLFQRLLKRHQNAVILAVVKKIMHLAVFVICWA